MNFSENFYDYHKIDGPPRLKRRGLLQALDFGDVQN